MNIPRALAVSLGVLALVPALRAADKDVEALAAKIDQRVAAAWDKDVKPAPLADDAEFFRRVHLDLAGRIPSVTEVRDFLDDDRPDKRRLWVGRILRGDPDDPSYRSAYVNHFTNVWRAWLLAQTDQQAVFRQPALEAWLQARLRANLGYDRLVRELLTQPLGSNGGRGPGEGSAAVFYQANELKPENLAGSAARLFLGVKIGCAQCHDHPFDKWTRKQFWEFAGFFTDVAPRGGPAKPALARGEIKVPGQDRVVPARFLDSTEPRWKGPDGTRPTLAEWMTAADNPYFARAAVNRMWGYFLGTDLVEQADGQSHEMPAAHKELLDELARQFVAHDYDVKFLIRALTASQTYQRTSAVSDPSQKDLRLFARMSLRGLSPEQLFDSLAEATEYRDTGAANAQSARGQFLARFPPQDQRTDYQTSVLQALYLMNNEFIADRTSLEKNRTLATVAEQRTSTARKVEALYLVVLSRKPGPAESSRFVKYIEQGGPTGNPKRALADVFWVLLNSPEFLLNH
jgi:hypothetical protein